MIVGMVSPAFRLLCQQGQVSPYRSLLAGPASNRTPRVGGTIRTIRTATNEGNDMECPNTHCDASLCNRLATWEIKPLCHPAADLKYVCSKHIENLLHQGPDCVEEGNQVRLHMPIQGSDR